MIGFQSLGTHATDEKSSSRQFNQHAQIQQIPQAFSHSKLVGDDKHLTLVDDSKIVEEVIEEIKMQSNITSHQNKIRKFLVLAIICLLSFIVYYYFPVSNQSSRIQITFKQKQPEQKPEKPQDNLDKKQLKSHEKNNHEEITLIKQSLLPKETNLAFYPYQVCLEEENLFHYVIQESLRMYFRTRYGLYLETCFDISRILIEQWEKSREVVEWSKQNVRKGDRILYDNNHVNFQDIIILSRLVGQTGQIAIFNKTNVQEMDCYKRNFQDLYQLTNIKYTNRTQGMYQQYSTIITFSQQFLNEEEKNGLFINFSSKILVYFGQKSKLKVSFLKKIKEKNGLWLQKINLVQNNCQDKLNYQANDFTYGFYQIVDRNFKLIDERPIMKTYNKSSVLSLLQMKYQDYKKKLPSPSQKKNISNILETFPLKFKEINKINEEEKRRWAEQKQIILWVQNRTQYDSVIYFEYESDTKNIFTILNLALLVPKGKLLISYSSSIKDRISQQALRLKISNIQFVKDYSGKTLQSNVIITHNLSTIQKITQRINSSHQLLLSYINESNKQSQELIYKLYAHYHIRKVGIFPSFYYGYEIFENFFWSSEHPSGFYEILEKTQVVFTVWNGAIKDLSPNKRYSITQIIKVSTAEVKVINPAVTPYFSVPEEPIHKAFELLSLIHKSDYLRCYLLYHYGGGYTDVKHLHTDLKPYFKRLDQAPEDIYIIGYSEVLRTSLICQQIPGQIPCKQLRDKHKQLMGSDLMIHRKKNPIIKYWYIRLHKILDQKYEKLKKHPPKIPKDSTGKVIKVNGKYIVSQYPLRYFEANNEIYPRAQNAYFGHYYRDLPYRIFHDYK